MKTVTALASKKKAFNLLLNENIVREARGYTSNLSATVESLLMDFVARQEEAKLSRQQLSEAVAEAWNRFNDAQGSFADEYTTL